MMKPALIIYGNVVLTKCLQMLTGGGKSDYIIFATPERYDLSNAIKIYGDVRIEELHVNGLVLITGDLVFERGGCHG